MRIIITETQLKKIISEGNEDVIKKKLETLYKAFRKGSFNVNTGDWLGERPEDKNLDIVVNYELPDVYKIVLDDKLRKMKTGNYYPALDYSIWIPDIKVWSEQITDRNLYSRLKKHVFNILMERFKKITDTDLILKPTSFAYRKDKWVSID